MFHAPLEAMRCTPEEAVHIGDHLVDDIAGANEAGLHTIWVNFHARDLEDDDAEPDHTVTQLAEISPIITRLHR